MKIYKKLSLPPDTAWERFKIGKYVHWKIRYFFQGVKNIIKWAPTIYHDRDWDQWYILNLLQKKIEFQRACIVNSNRHTGVDRDNFWMTVTLNLLEREKEEFYVMEKYDFRDPNRDDEHADLEEMLKSFKLLDEESEKYLAKYKSSVRKILKDSSDKRIVDHKEALSTYVGIHNQTKCNNLLFEILKHKSAGWWD